MLGVMYAPNSQVTLMGMTSYLKKDMKHVTFMGPMGTNRLGTFSTQTSGVGDTSLSVLIKIGDEHTSRWHATMGFSLPTGSIDESATILTPINTQPNPRLPYPMQLDSGTYDLIAGLTYADSTGRWAWGSQWRSVIRLGENDEHYTLGDVHRLSGWLSHRLGNRVSVSGRLEY